MVAIASGAAATRPIIAVFFATSQLTGVSPEQLFGRASIRVRDSPDASCVNHEQHLDR
jgi:hypothetical protein